MQDTKTDPYLKSKGCRISEIIWSLDKLSAACQTSWQVNHNSWTLFLQLYFSILFAMSMIAIECKCLVMAQGSVCNLVCGDGEMVTSGPVLGSSITDGNEGSRRFHNHIILRHYSKHGKESSIIPIIMSTYCV